MPKANFCRRVLLHDNLPFRGYARIFYLVSNYRESLLFMKVRDYFAMIPKVIHWEE
jgi:hypothetical protein